MTDPLPGVVERAARAHAGVVQTLDWYLDDLAIHGRREAAGLLHALSARLVRTAPRRPGAAQAIDVLREAVAELACREVDHSRLVALLHRAADAVGGAEDVLESAKEIIAELARPEGGDPAPAS